MVAWKISYPILALSLCLVVEGVRKQFRFAVKAHHDSRRHPSCQTFTAPVGILTSPPVNGSINFSLIDLPPDLRRHPIPIVEFVIVFLRRFSIKMGILEAFFDKYTNLSQTPNRHSFSIASMVHFLKGYSLMASPLPLPTVYQLRSMSCSRNSFPCCSFSIFSAFSCSFQIRVRYA